MFYLESNTNKDGTRIILIDFCYSGKRLRMSTGLTIHPKYWDFDAEYPYPKRGFKYYSQYKARLSKYETIVNEAWLDLTLTHIPNVKELAEEIKRRFSPKQTYLHEFAMSLAESKKKLTKFAYNNLAKNIEAFNPELTFEDVNGDLMFDFVAFLYEKDYAQNTVSKMFQRFRSIMSAAVEKGLTQNMRYKSKAVQVSSIETTKVFLDEAELKAMFDLKLTGALDKARDLFLVAAYTGLRYSDINKISRESFNNRYFRVTTVKESRQIDIPVHPIVLSIMDKHDWILPKLSNVKLNIYIKDVAKLAKIDKPVIVTSFPGGVRKDRKAPKYELVTVHSARRSLICNLIMAGVEQEAIMAISGHRSYAAYKRYVRLSSQNLLDIAFKSDFFKNKLKVM